ncbi:hypothetical protein X777_16517 [Ooceraea biroi]|uniref:DUF7041 domain-containing protein n=1 Tax=Ooceraea biroi TaxID=2015173 RepID=A0A026WUM6_OOCBI|nr:hypothetical protein X777_16517 [Ooceraea biroi]
MALQRTPPRGNGNDVYPTPGRPSQEEATAPAPKQLVKPTSQLQELFASEFRNVRLPTFWKKRLALWFVQLESEFTTYHIRSDDVKFSAVIRHLDEETMIVVADALETPPPQDKYTHLKRILIERFTDSQEKQLRKLLLGIELGDKKPSVLLREM